MARLTLEALEDRYLLSATPLAVQLPFEEIHSRLVLSYKLGFWILVVMVFSYLAYRLTKWFRKTTELPAVARRATRGNAPDQVVEYRAEIDQQVAAQAEDYII